jgi:hypothetical protein
VSLLSLHTDSSVERTYALRYLQQCRSVVVTHKLDYIQHYHHLFDTRADSTSRNMVEVPLPFEDNLAGIMAELTSPDASTELQRIANNSWNDLRQKYISPAAK